MFFEEKDEKPRGLVVSSRIISLVGYIVIVSYCLYALVLICRRKETRCNLFLLGTVVGYTIFSVRYLTVLYLTYENKERPHKLIEHMQIPKVTADWIFQVLLLKTSLSIPVIFNSTKLNNETVD